MPTRGPTPGVKAASEGVSSSTTKSRLQRLLDELYSGDSPAAIRFRLIWILIDLLIIAFFIVAPIIRDRPFFITLDYAIAGFVALDLAARAYACGKISVFLRRPNVWVDMFVLATLLMPEILFNLAFLRVLRIWTLFNSDIFWRTIGRKYDETRVEDVTRAAATLITFIFVMTGFVYTSFSDHIDGYIDALYFTITTLTTTGYGDILLPGTWGRLLSIAIMTVGITLFVRLAQTIFRPYKVRFACSRCGLGVHDPDSVHCKACGNLLNIRNNED